MTIPGLFINNIIGWLRSYTNVCSSAAIALGFVLFLVKGGPVLLTIGVILIGLGYGCMQPIIYDKTSTSTAESHATFALALVMAMNYMAIITYPFILEILQGIFSTDTSYFPFLLSTILAGIFAVFTYFKLKYELLWEYKFNVKYGARKNLLAFSPVFTPCKQDRYN